MVKTNSFTQEIKNEIVLNFDIVNKDKTISLLASYIRSNGFITFKNGKVVLNIETENAQVIKFIYQLIRTYFPDSVARFIYSKSMRLNKNIKYILEIDDSEKIIEQLNLNFLESKININLTNKEEKVRGYIIGLFLACGSCNDPLSSNYHLEFSLKNEDYAQAVLKLTQKIKSVSFNFKTINRRNNYVVYLKKSDLISDFLAYIEANDSCIKFENIRVDRDFNNVTNRLVNCDAYNYKKAIENAESQIKMIEFVDKKLGIASIQNLKLRNLCYLRKEFPEASYSELAEKLSEKMEQTISKSNVNHLFRALKELAKRLNYEN